MSGHATAPTGIVHTALVNSLPTILSGGHIRQKWKAVLSAQRKHEKLLFLISLLLKAKILFVTSKKAKSYL